MAIAVQSPYASFCFTIGGALALFDDAKGGRSREVRPRWTRQIRNQSGDNMDTMGAGKKMVAVIGAGPAGLVAAKSMLEVGLTPVVFDKAPEIGGLWNPKSNKCWNSLKTNISRYSCCFSDFPWESGAPLFPSQRQVFEYLEEYAHNFLQPEHLSLGSEITSVTRSDGRWVVQWSSSEDKMSGEFEFVVFASGFFTIPTTPSIPGLDSFSGEVLHSSEYRIPESFRGKRVVVVGASFSSAEVASEIAAYATQVVNVVRRPLWVLPRCVALDPDSATTPFFPMDLAFYRRSTRRTHSNVEEMYKEYNCHFRKLCGDQGVLNPLNDTDPPIVGISDTYWGLVRSNRIEVRLGKVQEVQGREVILEDQSVLADIDCIIFCTGFRSSIPYLTAEVLDSLSFDPSDSFLPVLLDRATFHPSLPGSAFVGFYRGPFMGIMELQARWAASIFSGVLPPIPNSVQQKGIDFEKSLKAQSPRPHFPFGDYVGFADAIAAELKVLPSKEWCEKHDVVIPAHFRTGSMAENAVAILEKECRELSEGKMVPYAVFRSLSGSWTLHRQIENRMDPSQSGIVKGTATFTAMASSMEYLYSEVGELFLTGGKHFRVHRKYVYVYDTDANQINVFFEDQGTRGSPFHSLRFLYPKCSSGIENRALEQGSNELSGGWRAEGQHLCSKDMYSPSYRFDFQGNNLAMMEISYSVVGPQKEYTSTATYIR